MWENFWAAENQRARLGDALTHGESGLVFGPYFAGPLEAQALTTVLFDWPTSPSRWRWRVCKTEHVLGLSEHQITRRSTWFEDREGHCDRLS